MTMGAQPQPGDAAHLLFRAVLEALSDLITQECTRIPETDCLVHASGRIRWFGGSFVAKRVLFEVANGHLADDAMLVRRCAQERCQEPLHHVPMNRRQFGRWLGEGTTWRGRASA